MKVKVFIIISFLTLLIFGVGITYSFFNSGVTMSGVDQKLAGFIFNATPTDRIEIPIGELAPGDNETHEFSITNVRDGKKSDVSIEYELTILTPHYAPFIIELYKDDELVLTCDESFTRNENNELVCTTDTFTLSHENEELNNFKLSITFDKNYDTNEYMNLVDYVDVDIKSYQKI